MKKKFVTVDPSQTKKLGKFLAKKILKDQIKKRARVIALEGDLGGGKTTFLQGFAKGLGIKEKTLSPTFVIMKKFKLPKSMGAACGNFYHVDCYRIEKAKELLDLGFKEIVSNPKNIVAIEWADRVREIVPKGAIWIRFEFRDEKTRKIMLK